MPVNTTGNDGRSGLNPVSFPLSGTRLIEASAGTGKTYQIANLYVRLVLGLDEINKNPLPVEKILVVTFTRAATSELRGRIRARLEEVLHVFRGAHTEEDFIKNIKPDSADKRTLFIKRLNDAILSMDEASISTIHSFAVQAAKTFLFETGALADIQISESGGDARHQLIADIYRDISIRFSRTAPKFFALVPGSGFKGFQAYFGKDIPLDCRILSPGEDRSLQDLCNYFQTQQRRLDGEHRELSTQWKQQFQRSETEAHAEFCKRVQKVLNDGLDEEFEVTFSLAGASSGLVGYLHNQMALGSAGYGDKPSTGYYKNWLEFPDMDATANNPLGLLQRLREHFISYFEFDQEDIKRKVTARILEKLTAGQERFNLDEMSLEDVIRLINQKLKKGTDTRKDLQRIITQTYPVCLVDEFQDTDPEQFNMFNEIYSDAGDGTGFFMIGDPKQSIYAFRGADIFSYLAVRNKVEANQTNGDARIFSLDTNWRSKSPLVNATNALFRESALQNHQSEPEDGTQEAHLPAPVFLFKGIEYQDVKSCEDAPYLNKKRVLKIDGKNASSLVFIGNPDTDARINKETLRRNYAKDTAERIKALLHPKTGGKLEKDGKKDKPVRPRDIAVLVRSGTEARAVREELARDVIAIRCVYLSQKDSVFSDSEISEDLYHVLVAINEHTDKRRLKTALATPFLRGFKFDFELVDKIEESDSALESLIEEFGGYKQLWQDFGIMAALNRMLGDERRGLLKEIAKRQDSDRILTDFRHLADLLQTRDQAFGSAEQLIDWYANQLNDDSSLDEDSKRIRLESDEDLVKIVTIHVSKGLQYPIVFLPFFYMPWTVDIKKSLPLYHQIEGDEGSERMNAVVDFVSDTETVGKKMQNESLAEDMRLLYVAITRAIYQCNIGISASTHGGDTKTVFHTTVWAHLLGIESSRPDWPAIQEALRLRFGESLFGEGKPVVPSVLGAFALEALNSSQEPQVDTHPVEKIVAPEKIVLPKSYWQITSYSALAHGKKVRADDKGDDETMSSTNGDGEVDERALREDDKKWSDDARYTLKGSAITGNCLHGIFETCALEPGENFSWLVERLLTEYGLDKPPRDGRSGNKAESGHIRKLHIEGVQRWLTQVLHQPLQHNGSAEFPSLFELFGSRQLIPEMAFDFAIGSDTHVPAVAAFNKALDKAKVRGLQLYSDQIHGLMTGSVDLVFIHENKVYVLDYKSNTLGKAARFYEPGPIRKCMEDSRYDLQYMIYSAAVHRYFSCYFADKYAFDPEAGKGLSFGGVFYLFLRGMGLKGEEYQRHGVFFTRPEYGQVKALDDAFRGDV